MKNLPASRRLRPEAQQIVRIALFTYSTKPRGSVVHTLELAEALRSLGHDVCVYALDKDGLGFGRSLACRSVLVPAQPVAGNVDQLICQRIQEFVDYLSSDVSREHLRYDYYHAQDCISANALAVLRERQQIPHFVRTVHHIDDFTSVYLQECQERSIHQPDRCLCVSHYWQTELQRRYQIKAPRVINGVNYQRFSASSGQVTALKQRLGLTGSPIYLTVGGIEPRKNTIALLHAFLRVREQCAQAQLVIAGGATLFDYQTYREAFFALVDESGIAIGEALILPGVVADADLPALYRSADAFVFPSVKEGWGLVVLEAIASGLPVVTADQPPFTEFLTPQQALLIDPASVEAIAAAMLTVVRPDVARSLIRHSQSLCEHYTWKASAKMHLDQYATLDMDSNF